MKIVHITWALGLGGLETMLVNIANNQAKSEDITIIIINNSNDNELLKSIDNRINVICLNRSIKSKSILQIVKLNLILIKSNPDIIHIHAPRVGMVLLPFFFKSRLIYTVHDVGIDKKYFKYYKHFCAISKCVKNDLKDRLNLKSTIIYNGINIERIRKSTNPILSNKFRLVQVSRLMHEKKGQDILIKAIAILKQRGINVELDLIGEGDSKIFLEQLIKDLNLNNVHLLGAKRNSYINEHLCDYDLLVQPSRFEGFGLTVAEGMAAKIPVLVSSIDGPMEIIENGTYGFYFENGDANDCANKIEAIKARNNELLIEEAYVQICNNFDVKITAQRYLGEYKKILSLL